MSPARLPLVDLSAQYVSMKAEINEAIAAVATESAFVGSSENRFVRTFEEEFGVFAGLRHVVACANGTDSLEILLRAAGIGPGDEVLVPAVSWIATSEAVSTCGATPVFVDILPGEHTIDPNAAAAKVTGRTAAIIPVHLYGMPARLDALGALARKHDLFVLEDCAQAHGATFEGRRVGTFGDAASFSFFPSKNLGAWGDAGAMATSDDELAQKARMIAQHGQTAKKHEHVIEGRNSRMDGLQAAILSAKLKHLPAWTTTRRRLAAAYRKALAPLVDGMQAAPATAEGVFHLFTVELSERERVMAELAAAGIGTAVHYPTPLPLLAAYERFGLQAGDFPIASSLTRRVLSIPLFPEMTDAQQDEVVSALRKACPRSNA
jgi:dTDP-4-amino-4,6-dideoxygalactose transaminase